MDEKKTIAKSPGNPGSKRLSRRKLLASIGITGAALASSSLIHAVRGGSSEMPEQQRGNPNHDAEEIAYRYGGQQPETTVADKLRSSVSVSDFGAKGDGETDDTAAIQAAIDEASAITGRVQFGAGTFVCGQLVLKQGAWLEGVGMATVLKLADQVNDDFIVSENFANLTGSNLWKTADGVPYGFGLSNLVIDGNKAMQTDGRGVVIYGKGYTISRVTIINTRKEGFYSECGAAGGQDDYTDLPESHIESIYIYRPGIRGNDESDGFVFRGPHDAMIGKVVVASSDRNGAVFEISGSFNGKCDVCQIHVYGSYRKGIVWGAGGSALQLIGESCDEEGVLVTGYDAQIGMIEAYRNGIRSVATGREYNVYIEGAGHQINQIETRDSNNAEGGIFFAANRSDISVKCDGQGKSGKTGLKVTGTMSSVRGIVSGFNQAGGTGLDMSGNWNSYDLTVDNCDTAFQVSTAAIGVDAVLRANLQSDQTLFEGSEPISGAALNKCTSNYDVTAQVGTTYFYTRQRKKSSAYFDASLATGSNGTLKIGHNCPFVPDLEDIMTGVYFDNGAGGPPAGNPAAAVSIMGVDDSEISFRWTIVNPGLSGDRGFIVMNLNYA